MKRITYILYLVGVLFVFSCGKKTEIKGVIAQADSSRLVLENFHAGVPIQLKDIILNKDGKFHFKVPALDTTEIYNLYLDSNKVIRLVVNPQEKVTIKTTKEDFGNDYQVEGSKESALVLEAERKLWQTRQSLAEIKQQYQNAEKEESRKQLAETYEEKVIAHHDYLRRYVFDNASSLAAYLALYQKIDAENYVFGNLNDDKYVRVVAQKMKMEHPQSPYFGLLLKELEQRNVQKRNVHIAEMIKKANNSYPNLLLKDKEGREIELSKLQSKYALLYFGVLNDASKAALTVTYHKYKKRGLEIYFVDENPNVRIWRQAVKELKTPWINVHDTNGLGARIYNVTQVPANYLIDIDGTIEGKNLFGRYLTEKLDKVL